MDKGYLDYTFLRQINDERAFFVTRAKDNMDCRLIGQHSEANKKGVVADELVELKGYYTSQDYPKPLRLIHYIDWETSKELVFLTNVEFHTNPTKPASFFPHYFKHFV
jgi:hypothetical protein